jgi:hypothetical protein
VRDKRVSYITASIVIIILLSMGSVRREVFIAFAQSGAANLPHSPHSERGITTKNIWNSRRIETFSFKDLWCRISPMFCMYSMKTLYYKI